MEHSSEAFVVLFILKSILRRFLNLVSANNKGPVLQFLVFFSDFELSSLQWRNVLSIAKFLFMPEIFLCLSLSPFDAIRNKSFSKQFVLDKDWVLHVTCVLSILIKVRKMDFITTGLGEESDWVKAILFLDLIRHFLKEVGIIDAPSIYGVIHDKIMQSFKQ